MHVSTGGTAILDKAVVPERKEKVMHIPQSDLFRRMDREFVARIMDLSENEGYRAGDFIFRQGDPADHLYILLKGRVRLTLPEPELAVHTVSRGGEVFAWSSLVGRETYTATAECLEETKVLAFDRKGLARLLDEMPAYGMMFYRRLARSLGDRLVNSYRLVYGAAVAESAQLAGTDQLMDVEGVP
jgi:CRP-like cAMP-binding protein